MKEFNSNGCLNFALATISSCFEEMEKDKHRKYWDKKFDRKVERAFVASNFVQAACDCTDNFIQEKLLKLFDKSVE